MYRDGSSLISACIVGLVLYGSSLALFLPDATVAFEPDEPPPVAMDLNLVSAEIGDDPNLPTNYTVDPIEEVGPVLPQ